MYKSTRVCPHCKERASADAVACPHCTRDLTPVKEVSVAAIVLMVFIAIMTLMILFSLSSR